MGLRTVRKEFRKELRRLFNAGEAASFQTLKDIADVYFGSDGCGYRAVLDSFKSHEVNNAMAFLRGEGMVETVGKQWIPTAKLESEDWDVIQYRRMKRVRGELAAGIRIAHEQGDHDLAAEYAAARSHLVQQISEYEKAHQPAE